MSKSLIQIAKNQTKTIDAMMASQHSQIEAYQEMTRSNKMRDDDHLFDAIEVYDGSDPTRFENLLDSIDQAVHISKSNLRKELMKKLDGVVHQTLSMMGDSWLDDDVIAKLHQDFSSLSTMNRAGDELRSLVQQPGQPITVYIYNYRQMHYLATGIRADRETHPFAIQEFIASLDSNLKWMVVRKYTEARQKSKTFQQVFTLMEECSSRMLEAESYDHNNSTTFRLPSAVNELCSSNSEINEVSHDSWNNNRSGSYGNKQWNNKDNKPWNKQVNNSKSFQGNDRKPWHKYQKQWQNKDLKPWQNNKKPKPKDACITITKDVKYFCPTGYDEGTFNAITKLLHKKVEQAKRSGSTVTKTVNAVEHENFINFFKIPEQLYDAAYTQVIREATPKTLGSNIN